MAENSNEEEQILDEVLRQFTDSDFIAVFFLLINKFIKPKNYLEIIDENENKKKDCLKRIFLQPHHMPAKDITSKESLLKELLWTIQRYDLLKYLDDCRHNYKCSRSSLNVLWKSLYEICESFDIQEDLKYFKNIFPHISISAEDYLEVLIVKEYILNGDEVSKLKFSELLTNLNKHSDNQKSRTWALDSRYSIRQPIIDSPCGLALIINHENFSCESNSGPELTKRKDSSLDTEVLCELWKKFGFKTEIYVDCKKEEILNLFKKLSKRDLSCYDIFVTCYMSHGNEGVVYASDCKPIEISCLIDFMANKCKSLVDKPKLFIIQACQGTKIQCGISNPVISSQQSLMSVRYDLDATVAIQPSDTPLFVDVLIAISTIPGFASFASNNKNSWFIEAFVNNVEQLGHLICFSEVMARVTKDVSYKIGECVTGETTIKNCKQTVETRSTLRKILQLKKINS